jgi:hypothetical protein
VRSPYRTPPEPTNQPNERSGPGKVWVYEGRMCGSCQHWKQDFADGQVTHRPCEALLEITAHPTRLRFGQKMVTLPAFIRTESDDWAEAAVYTAADFGCTLWEKRQ